METKNMIYLVSEYASQGEIFGEWFYTCAESIAYVNQFSILQSTFFMILVRKNSISTSTEGKIILIHF